MHDSVAKTKIFYRHACGVVGLALFIRSLRYFYCSSLLAGELHALYAMNKGKNIVKSESSFGGNGAKICDPTEQSKIRILLCDRNTESCREIFSLLCQCSYQVTSAWSDVQIVDALNSDGPHTDIILAEVSLLMANGAKMLRYIMHHKDLQHIPVIILSTRDEVSITINGLRLGAADYLVKPLQVKELSVLWMHMQKRSEALDGCCSRIKRINI